MQTYTCLYLVYQPQLSRCYSSMLTPQGVQDRVPTGYPIVTVPLLLPLSNTLVSPDTTASLGGAGASITGDGGSILPCLKH
jgi:hypothetical protein